jgi:excisionase family DNA binding protein
MENMKVNQMTLQKTRPKSQIEQFVAEVPDWVRNIVFPVVREIAQALRRDGSETSSTNAALENRLGELEARVKELERGLEARFKELETSPNRRKKKDAVQSDYLTPDQIARKLGLHRRTVLAMISRGEIQAVNPVGNRLRIHKDEFDRLLNREEKIKIRRNS